MCTSQVNNSLLSKNGASNCLDRLPDCASFYPGAQDGNAHYPNVARSGAHPDEISRGSSLEIDILAGYTAAGCPSQIARTIAPRA